MKRSEEQLLEWAEKYNFMHKKAPIIEKAKFTLVYDVNGKEYMDFNSGQMCSALGHNHPTIIKAITESCNTIIHSNNTLYNAYEIELAKRLCEICPEPLKKAFFMLTGADSNDGAMTIAKTYTGGWEFATPHVAFAGISGTPRYVTFANPQANKKFGPAIGSFAMVAPYCYRCLLSLKYPECNLQCVDLSFVLLDAESVGALAGFITEPMFSGGGVFPPPEGWLKKIRQKCDERKMLLILDEAQTGLAKMGTMFAFETEGIIPDVLTISKHFGGGVSISAVVTTPEIEETVTKKGFVMSHSQANDPIGCIAAIASLDIILGENMCEKAKKIGGKWRQKLAALFDKYENVGDVRGRGLINGIELVEDRKGRKPAHQLGKDITAECLRNGLIFSSVRGGHILRFVPPFCTTDDEIERAYTILETSIKMALDKHSRRSR
jgi:2,2-dialkylglycine decarboxylase (pyruvate)